VSENERASVLRELLNVGFGRAVEAKQAHIDGRKSKRSS
jgi:hypothetical protein